MNKAVKMSSWQSNDYINCVFISELAVVISEPVFKGQSLMHSYRLYSIKFCPVASWEFQSWACLSLDFIFL